MFEIYSTVTKKKKTQKTSIFIFSKIVLHILLTFVCWSTREQGWAKKNRALQTFFSKRPFFLKKKWYFLFCYMLHNNLSKQEQKKRQQSRRPYPF